MVAATPYGHGCVSFARESLLRSVGLHKSLRLEIFFSVVTDGIHYYILLRYLKTDQHGKLVEETGEISEDLRDTDRDAMQKAKHALKRPPLKYILKWTTLDAVSLFAWSRAVNPSEGGPRI
ncbi:hypothetical protein AC624_18790 [Bacillus sp. FJAT-27238]|nr:hypothetical protein AC624_18790 [Bacillus sp. FJAT-27238]